MQFSWNYPIYLIPHGGGFASIVDPDSGEPPVHLLVVHTEAEATVRFMERFEITGQPKALENDREFFWLLERLRPPVTRVAFDPNPDGENVNARFTSDIETIVRDHLDVDYSPWNYPVYAIARDEGFLSINGTASDGRPLTAIGIFTSVDKAQAYLRDSEDTGTLCRLGDTAEARKFLDSLELDVFAVAVDPVVEEDRRSARYCFDIATLLEKYLVSE